MRGFEDSDDYYDWVEQVAEHVRHVGSETVTAQKHIVSTVRFGDFDAFRSAGLGGLTRAWPSDVIQYSDQWPSEDYTGDTVRDIAVQVLADDLSDVDVCVHGEHVTRDAIQQGSLDATVAESDRIDVKFECPNCGERLVLSAQIYGVWTLPDAGPQEVVDEDIDDDIVQRRNRT